MINEISWFEGLQISEVDFNHRKSTCMSCEDFIEESVKCKVCGCPAANFWISPTSACPAGKFNQIVLLDQPNENTTEGTSTTFEREGGPALSS